MANDLQGANGWRNYVTSEVGQAAVEGMPVTPAERTRLRELAERATPGPWESRDGGCFEHQRAAFNPWWMRHVVVPLDGPPMYPGHRVKDFVASLKSPREEAVTNDANYIAAANPQTVLRLLDALDRAEATNARLNRRCQSYEAGLAEKIKENRGRSLGRALAIAGYMKAEAEVERLREALRQVVSQCHNLPRSATADRIAGIAEGALGEDTPE